MCVHVCVCVCVHMFEWCIHSVRIRIVSMPRWREESKTLTQKFEQTVMNLKAELNRYKQYSEELAIQLQQLKLEGKELASQLLKATNANTVLQQQLGEAETLVESTNSQLVTLLAREKQLLQERRELQRQLDKIKVNMNRIGRLVVLLRPLILLHVCFL